MSLSDTISPNWERALWAIPAILGAAESARGRGIGGALSTLSQFGLEHAASREQRRDISGMEQLLGGIDPSAAPTASAQYSKLIPLLKTMSPAMAKSQLESVEGLAQNEELAAEKAGTKGLETRQIKGYGEVLFDPIGRFNGAHFLDPNTLQPVKLPPGAGSASTDKPLRYSSGVNEELARDGIMTDDDLQARMKTDPVGTKKLLDDAIKADDARKQAISNQEAIFKRQDLPLTGKDADAFMNDAGEGLPGGIYSPREAAAMGYRYHSEQERQAIAAAGTALTDLRTADEAIPKMLKSNRLGSLAKTTLADLKGDPTYTQLQTANTSMLSVATTYTKTLRINQSELAILKSLQIRDSDTAAQAKLKVREMRRRLNEHLKFLGVDGRKMDSPELLKLGDPITAAHDTARELGIIH